MDHAASGIQLDKEAAADDDAHTSGSHLPYEEGRSEPVSASSWSKKRKWLIAAGVLLAAAVIAVAVAVPVTLTKSKSKSNASNASGSNNVGSGSGTGSTSGPSTSNVPQPSTIPAPKLQTAATIPVNVGTSPVGANLAATFGGFSYEKNRVATGLFNQNNAALVGLFKRIGQGNLRVGGNSVDSRVWNANAPGKTSPWIAPSDVDGLAGFLKATGYRCIYGIAYINNTPAQAAQEAAYVAKAFGSSLYAFEIGNEPNAYAFRPGLNASGYNATNFANGSPKVNPSGWSDFAHAIRAVVPNAPLSGPAASSDTVTSFTAPFAAAIASEDPMLITHHYYRGKGSDATMATAQALFLDDPWLSRNAVVLRKLSSSTGTGARFAEANSFSGGGTPGVSNTFASSLWVLKFLYILVQQGFSGADFHGGGQNALYSPISDDGFQSGIEVRPLYTGLLAFARTAKGRLLSLAAAPTSSAQAFVTQDTDGTFRAALVNLNASALTYDIAWPSLLTGSRGTAMLLQTSDSNPDSSIKAADGILLGGASVGNDGSWYAKQVYNVSVARGHTVIDVPAYTAMLLELPPA